MVILCLKPTIIKIYVRLPLEALGLNVSFFWQRWNHHDHLVDRASPFFYPLQQSIHLHNPTRKVMIAYPRIDPS